MKFVLCDTNVFISLFNGMSDTMAQLKEIGDGNVLIPSISVMELYRGMNNKTELRTMKSKLKSYNILHFNEAVSHLATEFIYEYKLSHNLQLPDAMIGAMSITYDIPLFTYNKKDFKFLPNIRLH